MYIVLYSALQKLLSTPHLVITQKKLISTLINYFNPITSYLKFFYENIH